MTCTVELTESNSPRKYCSVGSFLNVNEIKEYKIKGGTQALQQSSVGITSSNQTLNKGGEQIIGFVFSAKA